MPYKDKEKNKELIRDWMKRNPEKVRAAKQRWKEKRRIIKSMTRIIRMKKERLPKEAQKVFRKLRRNGVNLKEAQRIAYEGL